jgi:hypothetical protein
VIIGPDVVELDHVSERGPGHRVDAGIHVVPEREHPPGPNEGRGRRDALWRQEVQGAELIVVAEDAPGRPGRQPGSDGQVAIVRDDRGRHGFIFPSRTWRTFIEGEGLAGEEGFEPSIP